MLVFVNAWFSAQAALTGCFTNESGYYMFRTYQFNTLTVRRDELRGH